jgi:hypothetical protein
LTIFIALNAPAQARVSVTLAWDTDPDSVAAGYNVYYGTASRTYTQRTPAGNTNQVTIPNLVSGVTYFFAVTAVDAAGLESDYSGEIVFTPPSGGATVSLGTATNGQFILTGAAPAGHTYDVLATQDFNQWTALGTVTAAADGSFKFVDPTASSFPSRFYRLHDTTYTPPGLPNLLPPSPDSGGGMILHFTGQLGHVYDVLASPDLKRWIAIGSAKSGADGKGTFMDPAARFCPSRFYRLHDTTYTLPGSLPYFESLPVGATQITLKIHGQVGHMYDVQATQDFQQWTTLARVTVDTGGLAVFMDLNGMTSPPRFYRLREVPPIK